jgi:isoleucyl-tRNA synthetase
MYKKVEAWIDLVELEHRVQKFWDETNAFEKLRKKNEGNEPWSFLDGPITANNPMGVHHAMGRTLKDTFQRYWAMNGRDQRYQNGFDCQGLWIEVEVEKQLGFNSKREIEDYGVDKFIDICKARATEFGGRISDQSIRLGFWMDWTDSYWTMSDENNYTIWSFLKKCHERGKIYRGTDVMPWSGRSGTGYSHMEVIEGRKLVAHEALFLKFPLKGRNKENLLIWTTTPWTLTSNVAAMVGGELDYVKLRCLGDGEVYYFAAENLKFQRLERQFKEKKEWIDGVPKLKTLHDVFEAKGGYEIEGTLKGAEMVGWEYTGPFDELEAQAVAGGYPFTDPKVTLSGVQAHKVIDGGRDSHGSPVVTAGEGAGIVHTAPGCGDIDHTIGKQLGLPAIAPLDDEAKFIDKFGELTGKHALDEETVQWIFSSLKEKGLLVHTEMYPHVYPHCWRSGDPLVFRLVDEWFIDMGWRDEIKEVAKQINWIPGFGLERELEWLTNMRDWMISKKRYWGLALPIWVCDECEHFEVIGGKEELQERAVEGWEQFEGNSPHKPFIDKVKIKCPKCGGTSTRIPDVGNPWLDAGIVPYSTVKYSTDRDYWKKWMPADLVLECFPGQFRNWFYALLAMSTMMENIPPFKTLVGHSLVLDENGEEMHKSKGNAIWFEDAADKMGADVMRWIYCSHDYELPLNFGYNVGREVRGKFYNTLWNSYSFFVNYARLIEFTPPENPTPFSERPDFDRWILSELQVCVQKVRASVEEFNTKRACIAIEAFVQNLSNWYIRLNRRRFWKSDNTVAYETLYEALTALIGLVAPIMPFTTEEIYQNLVRACDPNAPESVHHTEFPVVDETRIDTELNEDMAALQGLVSIALGARESAKVKVRQPLSVMTIGPADEIEKRAAVRFSALLAGELNVKKVEVTEPKTTPPDVPIKYVVKPNLKIMGKRMKKQLKAFKKAFAEIAENVGEAYGAGETSFTVQVDGEPVVMSKDELLVKEESGGGAALIKEGDTWVHLDTTIDADLRIEGLMRELLRRLQVQRKENGLEIEDRINISYATDSADLKAIFERFTDYLKDELLADAINEDTTDGGTEYKLGGEKITVLVAKA